MTVTIGAPPPAPVPAPGRAPDAPARSGFRADIEGLRAVTALMVAGFHIWGDKVSGGVDVFFVVSGYFITLTLLGQVQRHGRVRPGAFLARLGQRLGPMAVTVLVATMAMTWLFLTPSVRGAAFGQSIAALFSVENLVLAFQSTDYLAQGQPRSPVQQFWAMSVQGQFYVLWLVIALVAVAVAANRAASVRRTLAVLVVVVSVASFAWSVVQTADDQAFAYFSPLTRAWEFGIGALVALVLPHLALRRGIRIAMVWVGLLGIVAGAVLLPVESAFPGSAALWPTLCAALIMLSGQKGGSLASNAMLSHPVLVRMGGFAFGIYLWHWPLLIVARSVRGSEQMGWLAGSAVILTAIVLAWATARWIERPLLAASRSEIGSVRRRGNVLIVVAWCLALAMAVSSLAVVRVEADRAEAAAAAIEDAGLDCLGAPSVLSGDPSCSDGERLDALLPAGLVAEDLQQPEQDCAVRRWHAEAKMCTYGAVGSSTRIGLIGNSHAIAWFPALERVALDHGWELRVWYKSGCQFASVQRTGTVERAAEECDRWVQNVQDDIRSGPPISWFATSTHGGSWWADTDGVRSPDAARASIESAWQPLIARGSQVVAIRDYPKTDDASLACVEREGVEAVDRCARPRADVLIQHDEMYLQALAIEGAHGIDLTDAFCDAEVCRTAAGNVKVYRDHSHISATYAATIGPLMEERLVEAGLVAAATAAG